MSNQPDSVPPTNADEACLPDIMPPIGHTNRKVYWSVLLGSLLMLAGLLSMIANGAVAVTLSSPVPLELTASTLTLSDFSLRATIIEGEPVLINKTDLTASNIDLILRINLPALGRLKVELTASHADIEGLTTTIVIGGSVTTLNAPFETIDHATFQGVSLTLSVER